MMRLLPALAVLAATALAAVPDPVTPDPATPRPIAARDSVWIEDLTWMEVRDALQAGKKTVIVPTGGIEQNGPWLATGKHNVILKATCESIARELGNALVAPIVAFVPEGDIDPPGLHMKYPGTISLTEETYRRLLNDICASLKVHGFTNIVLLGDSGGNQEGMKAVAEELNARWSDGPAKVHYIPEYYDYPGVAKWLESQGIKQGNDGIHDDFAITAQMMVIDPSAVRMEERITAGKFQINGINLAPAEKTIAWGRKIVAFRTDQTVKAVRGAIRMGVKKRELNAAKLVGKWKSVKLEGKDVGDFILGIDAEFDDEGNFTMTASLKLDGKTQSAVKQGRYSIKDGKLEMMVDGEKRAETAWFEREHLVIQDPELDSRAYFARVKEQEQ
ncbi:MAG: creatininase family protein [Pirellulales bacterium]